ncbi:MAG: mycothiol-dependent nitroreductase Rv2466c family protein [Acidimicrobiia bacterium]
MADLDFFWDPVCPWAWITSRWVLNVADERPLSVDWKFISLRKLNAGRDYEREFPKGYARIHERGLELLRVAAAVRAESGPAAMLPLYTAYGRVIHNQDNSTLFDDRSGIAGVLAALDHPTALAEAAYSDEFDDVIGEETDQALDRCGGFIGTPVLSFLPPDGPSFFGPVISQAPTGADAVRMWDAVRTLAENPDFSELKRSVRGKRRFDDTW